jgi:hypothetical protein
MTSVIVGAIVAYAIEALVTREALEAVLFHEEGRVHVGEFGGVFDYPRGGEAASYEYVAEDVDEGKEERLGYGRCKWLDCWICSNLCLGYNSICNNLALGYSRTSNNLNFIICNNLRLRSIILRACISPPAQRGSTQSTHQSPYQQIIIVTK